MPVDAESGLHFTWIIGPDGKPHRDFNMSVDDRFEFDEATGEIVQVREKASGALYDEPPDKWPEGSGAKELRPVARWADEMPDDVREAVEKIDALKGRVERARRKRGRGHG